jgi:cell volume regulation protein A
MADVPFAFAAFGAIILIGFLSTLAFEKTKVPDVIVLIMIGLIFGPIALTFFNFESVSQVTLEAVAPYFTSLALIIILFDGGLNLNFEKVLSKIGHAVFFAAMGFVMSVAMITIVCYFVFAFPLLISILLASILGGTSSAVILDILRRMKIKEETRQLLILESVITDVLCVVVALSILQMLVGGSSASVVVTSLATEFSIAIVAALVFGIIWLRTLKRLQGKPFSFMITIAALLLIYSGVEMVGGSGFVAALVFGLVLGNKEEVARMFRIKSELVFDERIKSFHSEVSFLIKTVFFVYLGLSFTLDFQNLGINNTIPYFSPPYDMLALFVVGIILITGVIMLARYINTRMTVRLYKDVELDRNVMFTISSRGLASAALATLPFTIAAYVGPPNNTAYYDMMASYRTGFLNITFLIILITVAITSISIYLFERQRRDKTIEEMDKSVELRKVEKEVKRIWKKEEKKKRIERIRSQKENEKKNDKQDN